MTDCRLGCGEIAATTYPVDSSSGLWCSIHALRPGVPTEIGDGGDNQIVLHSNRCSRRHREIV